MTASNPLHDESTTAHLDSTAHLMNRISSQLASQLSLVSLDGRRRPEPPALVVVAHGSRDPRALSTVRALLDKVRALRPGLPVHLGHIELNEPLLPDTLAALGTREAVLVPLLLSRGYHVKRDIPEMAAEADVHARVAPALGPHPLLVEALYARLVEAGWRNRMDEPTRRASAVVLAAAGSRDPDSKVDTARTAHLLANRLGRPGDPGLRDHGDPDGPGSHHSPGGPGPHQGGGGLVLHSPRPLRDRVRPGGPMDRLGPLGHPPSDGPPPPPPLRQHCHNTADDNTGIGVGLSAGPGGALSLGARG